MHICVIKLNTVDMSLFSYSLLVMISQFFSVCLFGHNDHLIFHTMGSTLSFY